MAYRAEDDPSKVIVEELVRHLREGPAEAASPYCEELIRRFEPLLRRVWRRAGFGLPYDQYPDFVQEVFVRLLGGLPHLQNPKAFPGYFRRIALSVVGDFGRERARVAALDRHWRPERASRDADREILENIFVWSYLEHLAGREKEVLTLEFVHQMPVKEIAQKLGLTPGGVRTTKTRALNRLREILLADARVLEHPTSGRG